MAKKKEVLFLLIIYGPKNLVLGIFLQIKM